MKKNSMSESSSDIIELEDHIILTQEVIKKPNCISSHNNNINPTCMSIETDV